MSPDRDCSLQDPQAAACRYCLPIQLQKPLLVPTLLVTLSPAFRARWSNVCEHKTSATISGKHAKAHLRSKVWYLKIIQKPSSVCPPRGLWWSYCFPSYFFALLASTDLLKGHAVPFSRLLAVCPSCADADAVSWLSFFNASDFRTATQIPNIHWRKRHAKTKDDTFKFSLSLYCTPSLTLSLA